MELEFGEEVCSECKGLGWVKNPRFQMNNKLSKLLRSPSHMICPKCFGYRKLLWSEQVFGIQLRRTERPPRR